MLFERPDGRGIRIAPMPRKQVKLQGHRAQLAARNAALLILSERGLTCADIASLPGIDLDVRSIRHGINEARRLRKEWHEPCAERPAPKVVPLFGCQPWERAREELPRIGANCPHCGKRIARGERTYCPKCAASGFDDRLAKELGEAIRRRPPSPPLAKSRLQGRSNESELSDLSTSPKLSAAHRLELARTPQGYLWLKSIGQLPEEPVPARQRARGRKAKKYK
jgi:hypothetical protein